jgi:hypothetical protein
MPPRVDLATILQGEKLVSAEELRRLAGRAEERGVVLAEAVLEARLLTQDRLVALLAERLGIALAQPGALAQAAQDDALRACVPMALARASLVVPLARREAGGGGGWILTVAACDPTDQGAIDHIRQVAGAASVEVYLASFDAVVGGVDRVYATRSAGLAEPVIEETRPGKVQLDPDLAREIAALEQASESRDQRSQSGSISPPRPLADEERTPVLTLLDRAAAGAKAGPAPPPPGVVRVEVQVPLDVVHRAAMEAAGKRARSGGAPHEGEGPAAPRAPDPDAEPTQVRRSPSRPPPTPPASTSAMPSESPALPAPPAAAERHTQTLSEIIAVLAELLEARLTGRASARELARLCRAVAVEMGLEPRAISDIGVAAELHALATSLAAAGLEPPDFSAIAGWRGGAPDTVFALVRGLNERVLGAAVGAAAPLGVRIIAAVAEIGARAPRPGANLEPARAQELLRSLGAPQPLVEAVGRVLAEEREHGEVTTPRARLADLSPAEPKRKIDP